MQITEAICTGNSRYRANQRLTPRGVVLHSIGTPQLSAQNLYLMFDVQLPRSSERKYLFLSLIPPL